MYTTHDFVKYLESVQNTLRTLSHGKELISLGQKKSYKQFGFGSCASCPNMQYHYPQKADGPKLKKMDILTNTRQT